MMPLVALVGRPNVGKSTLFNRLTRSRQALVDDTPGLTRDRQYGKGVWEEMPFRIVDTGGFAEPGEEMADRIREQALVAMEEADGVILVTDGRSGLLPDDQEIAERLRRSGKAFVCAVNKCESREADASSGEFFRMGVGDVMPISALHGLGVDDLMERLFAKLHHPEPETAETGHPADTALRVALVGCPNVGKSSLVNRLLGEGRQVVSDIPGTTRDSVDIPFQDREGRWQVLVDTAGLRRKNRISLRVEKYAVMAAMRAMERANVAILVFDAQRGMTDQDRRIASLAWEAGCGLVFAINKWDLLPGAERPTLAQAQKALKEALPEMGHGPIVPVSAMNGFGVEKLLPAARQVWTGMQRRLSTGELNRWLRETVDKHGPPRTGPGQSVKLRYITQVEVSPPLLVVFGNHPEGLADGYRRYLDNQLRER
ncbi:MAG: ribosome biogenesis GTPase Der, partial [Magnetococcales bacterium]|nr:ribosome biogenesis GTPase Der [Magnetococcales bacterium]